ncbi:MAG: hypothetical protein WB709_02535, partial [Solirubrobacteraceae bacterium]
MVTEAVTKIYAPWVALLALMSSLIVGFVQYEHSKHADRIARVMEFAKDFRGSLGQHAINFRIRFEAFDDQVIEPALEHKIP